MTTIRVYNGGGSSIKGTPRLIERLTNNLEADIRPIGSEEISSGMKWACKDVVIIFGAWTVRGFKRSLGKQGLSNLYNAVADKGVTYAGICAGAAFAADKITYDILEDGKKTKLHGEGLNFFHGYARGPIKDIAGDRPFEDTINDIHVIDIIRTQSGVCHKAAYWSGPMLLPKERGVLNGVFQASAFLKGTEIPMSMVGSHGNGRVVLYAHHPEITAWNWRGWIHAPNPTDFQRAKLNAMDAYLTGESFDGFIQDLGLDHIKTQTKKAGGLNLSALL